MSENQAKGRWSAEVTAHSDALDLEPNVFEKENAGEIARSLKRSAEASDRHTDVARRTDQLRTRMTAAEQAMAEIANDVADAEMRRTSRQARLSAISDTQADRVAARALRGNHRKGRIDRDRHGGQASAPRLTSR